MLNSIVRATSFVHHVLKGRINKNDVVIDATMGNGNDTLFLARLVGPEGSVFAFDIQQTALDRTLKKLVDNELNGHNIRLINDSHENIENYPIGTIDAAMFNLGYLPQGDRSIVTRPGSTIKGIKSVLKLLKHRGIMSIIIYYGHEGGMGEKQQVLDFIKGLPNKDFVVMNCCYTNQSNDPPIIIFIEKVKDFCFQSEPHKNNQF
ncbi:MAG TPA: class I SAM-dependent methyltransferase [Clostridia bacterium]|nr:class I SAM-dependent methyltransferase [Clostridia bacterium]